LGWAPFGTVGQAGWGKAPLSKFHHSSYLLPCNCPLLDKISKTPYTTSMSTFSETKPLSPQTLTALKETLTSYCASLLPDAAEKLQTALERSTDPKDILKVFTTISDYAQTSPTPNLPPATPIPLESITTAFQAIASAYNIKADFKIKPASDQLTTSEDPNPEGDPNDFIFS